MTPQEFTAARPTTPAITDVYMYDTLGSSNRLWVRGRLVLPLESSAAPQRGWWNRRGKTPSLPPLPASVHILTQVGGMDLQTSVPLRSDGYLEASFETRLPPARRGWRMARHQITVPSLVESAKFAEQTLRACNVVLPIPAASSIGLIVVLPLEFTYEAEGVQCLTESTLARRLTELLRALHDEYGAEQPIYYLCGVPIEDRHRQPELALAATTLGWPSGPIVLVPTPRADAAGALAAGIDRLRWLFAKQLEFVVINREPSVEPRLREAMKEQTDRAAVSHYAGATADLRTLRINGEQRKPLPARWSARPTRQRCVPRHPVVFCHGMLAMTMLRMRMPEDTNYFSLLRPFLHERGIDALYPNVAPTGGVVARAEQLRDLIRHWTDEPINLIAHSMGGLDARYLIAHLGMANRVASLTTITTPHHGTTIADWFCLNFRHRVPLLLTLEALGFDVDGFRDCCIPVCKTFNERTPNVSGVRYFSYTASVPSSRVSPLLRRAWNILTPAEGPNDGLVSVRSARWGEVIGSLSVDHFAQTPDGLFTRPGENFDAVNFYARLIEDLAHRGL
ncbi:MAG: esterase/lipase family protein [Gemmataceae bacterium]